MIPIIIFIATLLIQTQAYSVDKKCEDIEIKGEVITDLQTVVGDWTMAFTWDSVNQFDDAFKHASVCPGVEITKPTQEEVDDIRNICGDPNVAFDWDNVDLKLHAPMVSNADRLIAKRDDDYYILQNCVAITRVILERVDNYVAIVYPDVANLTELLVKEVLTRRELKCINTNLDIVKDLTGIAYCFDESE